MIAKSGGEFTISPTDAECPPAPELSVTVMVYEPAGVEPVVTVSVDFAWEVPLGRLTKPGFVDAVGPTGVTEVKRFTLPVNPLLVTVTV